MTRKIQRVPVHLDPKDIPALSAEEIRIILRGADELIMRGGRSLLVKILRGSQSKDVLDQSLDQSPVYGAYRDLSKEEVLARVDWVITNGYLAIEYDHRLPLLVYTQRGWAIEKESYACELLRSLEEAVDTSCQPIDLAYLNDKNREIIWLLLEKIEATGDSKYIRLLREWENIAYKKGKQRIRALIERLNG
ncbi:MAG: RQC-minor-1 family DNA-binding protein [Gemmataceae bacterium]